MKKETIKKFIGHLTELNSLGISKTAYEKKMSLCKNYLNTTYYNISQAYKNGLLAREKFEEIKELWEKISNKKNKLPEFQFEEESNLSQVELEADDDRNSINLIRDESGKIKYYEFKVLIRDKAPLTGRLTRDEMNTIYRMYSYYGMSITQREISRYFPEYSLIDFKRILRVFSITKAVAPFAPHVIEENSKEELMIMQMREKENDFVRGIEEQSIKNDRALLKKYALENIELKRKLEGGIKIDLEGLDLTGIKTFTPTGTSSKKNIIIYLSDMHIGAYVSPLSIYSLSLIHI